jgi:hypothetical protein
MSVLKVARFAAARKRGLDNFSSPLYTALDLLLTIDDLEAMAQGLSC